MFVRLAVAIALLPASGIGADAQTRVVSRVSIGTDLVPGTASGAQGDAHSRRAVISDDGRTVVFSSLAANLVPDDTNALEDVFVRSRSDGRTIRASVSESGLQANGRCWWASLSTTDGRWVAFVSDASNLAAGDSGSHPDIYLKDLSTGDVTRVTRGLGGVEANGPSAYPALSGDGKYLAFVSSASNLVAGDTNGVPDAFVWSRATGQIERVSVATEGGQANGPTHYVDLDGSGDRVVFSSTASNLASDDSNNNCNDSADSDYPYGWEKFAPDGRPNCSDVFLRSRGSSTTTRVSVTASGTQGAWHSAWPTISRNGRHVVFGTFSNLDGSGAVSRVQYMSGAPGRLIRVDLTTGTRQRVAEHDNGYLAVVGADGRYVAYSIDDGAGSSYPWVSDTASGTRTKVLVPWYNPGGMFAYATSVSVGGDVTFLTDFAMTSADSNNLYDVYVSSLRPSCTVTVSPRALDVSKGGGTQSIEVTATSGDCAWATFSEVSWAAVGQSSGIGSQRLTVTVSGATVARVGRVLIAEQPVMITQNAVSCSYSLSGTAVSLPATGGTAATTVSTPVQACTWQATAASSWLTVQPASGSGNGTVAVTATANGGPSPRTATVTIGGQAFTVSQPAAARPPQAAAFSRYLAEGATSTFFDTHVALLNPGSQATTATLTFQRSGQPEVVRTVSVPAHTRVTVDPKTIPALGVAEFSTRIDSDQLLVVDRTVMWDAEGFGAHSETGVAAPSLTWYLAEGATHSGLSLFYLLQNPNSSASVVKIRYLRPSGAPLEKTYTLPGASRTTLWVNEEIFAGQRMLASTDVSAVFEVQNGQPIIVERALYLSTGDRWFNAGHGSAAVAAPAVTWFLAEGATGPFMDTFVLIANPSPADAHVRLTYLLPDGTTFGKSVTVAANARFSVWIDHETPDHTSGTPLADTAVSTTVESLNGVPIIVERAMWWSGAPGGWYEAHNSPGSTQTGLQWAVADGEVGGDRAVETYLLIANTSSSAGEATVTLYFDDGTSATKRFDLPGRSRTNVAVADEFPLAHGRRFGTVVESQGASQAQIVVERAMYWNAGGVMWAAGTNALAMKIR